MLTLAIWVGIPTIGDPGGENTELASRPAVRSANGGAGKNIGSDEAVLS